MATARKKATKKPVKPPAIKTVEGDGMPLHLEWRTPEELADNPSNWRVHDDLQTKSLAATLGEFGWAGAALLNSRTNRLIDGHLRKKMPKNLLVDGKIPVLVGDFTEAQEAGLLATIDPIGALAGTNQQALGELLAGIQTDNADLQALLDSIAQEHKIDLFGEGGSEGLTDPDAVPEPPSEPVAKLGDVWVILDHRITCGDSTDPAVVDRLMQGEKADCLWVDCPYGVDYEGKQKRLLESRPGHAAMAISGDTEFDLGKLLDGIFAQAMRCTRAGASWYVAAPPGPLHLEFAKRLIALGVYRQVLVWIKQHFVLGDLNTNYNYQHENVYYGWKPGAAHSWYGLFDKKSIIDDEQPLEKMSKEKLLAILIQARDSSDIIRVDRPMKSLDHPTTKPVDLVGRQLFNSTKKGDIVVDLCGGSGTTMIACQRLGRKARLSELSPTYVDVAVRRIEEFTGKKAERIEG